MKPTCVFCPSPPTKKRGEHVFDDWLNRLDGREIKQRYTFIHTGRDGEIVRTYKKSRIDSTSPVVCDECNNGWMSDLTNYTKFTAEGFIRHQRHATLLPRGIATLAAFAFMKAAVIDAEHGPTLIPSDICFAFAKTRAIPLGSQVWLACFRSRHKMATKLWSNAMFLKSGAFKGYGFYVFTYAVGHLAIQLTYPKWTRGTIFKRPPMPFLTQGTNWNIASVPIWPNVTLAQWPPQKYLDDDTLKRFKDRFSDLRGPMKLS